MIVSVAEGLMRYCLLRLFHFPASLGDLMLHVILPQALYNGFIGAGCVLAMTIAAAARKHRWT